LSEDHKVAVRELNDILATLVGSKADTQEEPPKKSRKERNKSAKIRVRNLMKDAVEAPGEERAMKEAPSSGNTPAAPEPGPEPISAPAPEAAHQEDKAQHDIDDHDYATAFQDSDDSGTETTRKRRRKRKKALPRKKRKVNTENKDEERFMQNGYKCNVSFCSVRMNSHDNLVYHQRCHKKVEAKAQPGEDGKKADAKKEADQKPLKSRKIEYMCPECSKLIKSWVQLSGHLWRSHGIDMELHSCDQCEYKTPR